MSLDSSPRDDSGISSSSSPLRTRAYTIAIPNIARTIRKPLNKDSTMKTSLDVIGAELVARVKAVFVTRKKAWEEGKKES